MTSVQKTAAYWKRRAIKAEMMVEAMDKIRQTDASMERRIVCENADMRVAIMEIESALNGLKNREIEG